MRVKQNNSNRSGDTLIEVVIAMAIFASLAAGAIYAMNSGMYQAERAVEITMARNAIDAQAEALRFIQNNYIAEREFSADNQQYSALWKEITQKYAISPDKLEPMSNLVDLAHVTTSGGKKLTGCSNFYQNQNEAIGYNAFAINTRLLMPKSTAVSQDDYDNLVKEIIIKNDDNKSNDRLKDPSLYPRTIYSTLRLGNSIDDSPKDGDVNDRNTDNGSLLETRTYRKADSVQGIWVMAVRGDQSEVERSNSAEFYDFYVRTCWQAVGLDAPSKIETIVRLYNPEVIE